MKACAIQRENISDVGLERDNETTMLTQLQIRQICIKLQMEGLISVSPQI
jgi:hypothetical protein